MEYQGDPSRNYYSTPKVQLAISYDNSNKYVATNINSHVSVASYVNNRYVSSTTSVNNV
jgi:hypothetical protein